MPSSPFRVFIADDSPVDRRLIERLIEREDEFEIAGLGIDGTSVLKAVETTGLDAVVLDLEMPGVDGLKTLQRLKGTGGAFVVVLFTGSPERISEREASLLLGRPVKVLCKAGHGGNEVQNIGKVLVPWLKEACLKSASRPRVAPRPSTSSAGSSSHLVSPTTRLKGVDIRLVVLGSSTGGPNAVADVLRDLPPDFSVPICITQHMPEGFTTAFAERLNRSSTLNVKEAEGGELLVPGTVWVAPGGSHLEVQYEGPRLMTCLTDGPLENSCRPAVDPLFRTAASVLGPAALGVVLTGMGKDGLIGSRLLRERGAKVLVQDEASSVVWGMPGAVANAGLADEIVPLKEMAGRISSIVSANGKRRRPA